MAGMPVVIPANACPSCNPPMNDEGPAVVEDAGAEGGKSPPFFGNCSD